MKSLPASRQYGDYGFDRRPDQLPGDSLKWNRYAGRDILPMWVADMDFAAPPAVLSALHARVAQAHFGYCEPRPSLLEAVQHTLRQDYGWEIDTDWLIWLPGLVSGLNVVCRAIEGDVLTATPVYPPFLSAPRLAGRHLTTVHLCERQQRWRWDWQAMETAIDARTRLLLLCHPHNPVGRAWDDDELRQLADFCERHQLLVCSDEIHCGLLLDPDRRHRPLATLNAYTAAHSITLMAPSKTCNIPGLGCAFAVVPDARLRQRLLHAMNGIVPHVNALGFAACEAAYRDCHDWHAALIDYLRGNRDLLQAAVADLPALSMLPVEATYLAWIDARRLGVADPQRFFEQAGLGLSSGSDFGWPGWVRLNFGCARSTLEEAIKRLQIACT